MNNHNKKTSVPLRSPFLTPYGIPSDIDLKFNLSQLIEDIEKIAELARISLQEDFLLVNPLSAPHKPPHSLPEGKYAIYMFFWNDKCLKVGRVGKNSQARYTSQHYNPNSSNSNLSKFLLSRKEEFRLTVSEENIGQWIKDNCDRIDFLFSSEYGDSFPKLIEVFVQCRLTPIFEG